MCSESSSLRTADLSSGVELRQLARYLFNSAANKWFLALAVELSAGALGLLLSVLTLSDQWGYLGAVVVVLLLVTAYGLRVQSEAEYDTAATMRRQSGFTEGLGWEIGDWQLKEWRARAGAKALSWGEKNPSPPDWYFSTAGVGPRRLAEMTMESAFYTRILYQKVRVGAWVLLGISLGVWVLALSLAPSVAPTTSATLSLMKAAYALVPIVISANLLGWALRLSRLIEAIRDVERSLEQLGCMSDTDLPHVLRLVAEYNCQIATGFPVPSWLFNSWQIEIQNLWSGRTRR